MIKRGIDFQVLFNIVFVVFLLALPLPLRWMVWPVVYDGVYIEFTSISLYLSHLLLVCWLVFSLKRSSHVFLVHRGWWLGMVGLVGLTAVSSMWSTHPYLALKQAFHIGVVVFLCWRLAHSQLNWRVVQWGVGLSLLVQTAVAIGQFILQNDLGLYGLGELDLMTQAGGDSILFAGGQYWLRAYGLTPHPNILGGGVVMFILLLLPAYLQAKGVWQWGWLGLLLLGMIALFFSFSRAAWMGGVVGGAVFVLLIGWHRSRENGRSLLLFILAASLLLVGLGWTHRDLLLSRVTPTSNTLETRSVDERVLLMQLGVELWRESPVVGIGGGQTAVALALLLQDTPKVGPQPIHNIPVLLAVELGLVGVILWFGVSLYPFVVIINRETERSLWVIGCTAALSAFMIIDLFDYYTWGWHQGQLLHWLCFGLWALAWQKNKQSLSPDF